MAPGPSNSTHNDTIREQRRLLSAPQCISWFVVFGTECLAIIILNIITMIVFLKQCQLRRQSTYLIIHQEIVDLLVGLVNGPLVIGMYGSFYCDLWEYHRPDITWLLTLALLLWLEVYQVSLLNLVFISVERVHATFRPFKHCFIKKWVYGVMITISWFAPVVMNTITSGILPYVYVFVHYELIFFSYYFSLLFVVVVCYIFIYLKVRCNRHPQHHGAAGLRERKLTSTLLLVTLGSVITFLPLVVFWGFGTSNSMFFYSFSNQLFFHFSMVIMASVVANSLINPIIYAIRMPEVRTGLSKIIFRKALNPITPNDIPLQNL